MIKDIDVPECACLYCNYHKDSKTCQGKCDMTYSKCIGKIPKPESDKDCGCSSCGGEGHLIGYPNHTIATVCSGDCFNSGLKCTPTILSPSQVVVCSCQ